MSFEKSKIIGVIVRPLRQIPDERGKIMHMLRADEPEFQQFGEIYFSWVYPRVIKGWHVHKSMTLNYAVPVGMVKLVLYDRRSDSPSYGELQEIFIGEDNYMFVRIPPGVVNGIRGVGVKPAMVANCATEPYDRDEIIRLDPFTSEIPYDWRIKHG